MDEKQPATQSVQGSFNAVASDGSTAIVNVYQGVSAHPIDSATVAAAGLQLRQMPLEVIPAIAPLPHGSHVAFAPNPLFVGREAELRDLAATFRDGWGGDDRGVRGAAITGLGGVGKTQLATEFVYRYGQFFAGGVFWLSCAEASTIPRQIAECGRSGYLDLRPDFLALPLEDQVQMVLGAWQSALPRLLVFDNCEDEAVFAQWRPPTGVSRVLLTCRRAQWDATLKLKMLPLGEFQPKDSIKLLHFYTPGLQSSDADFAAIAAELGNLPLALHLAGSFLGKFQRVLTPQAYLAQLRKADPLAHSSLTKGSISATAHDQNVSRTFEVSYRNLDSTDVTDAQALALLRRAIYFAPGEPIPHRLLLDTLEGANDSDESLLLAESALIRLLELGLIQWVNEREDTLSMHRLLVKFLQEKNTDPNARAAVEQALAKRYEQIREPPPSPERTGKMNQLVGQVRGFAGQAAYTAADIQRIFDTGTVGNRIVALALSFVMPGSLSFSSIVESIRASKSAFEQYHALLAARELLPKLDDVQKAELAALLQDGAENIAYITQDTSRQIIRMSILSMLDPVAQARIQALEEQRRERWGLSQGEKFFDWIPDLPDQRDFPYTAPALVLEQLPPSADLRYQCPPIYDQGRVKTGTVHAISAAIAYLQAKQQLKYQPSRLFIYYNAKVIEENTRSISGMQIRTALKSVSKYGLCPEDMWPYDIAKIQERPPESCYEAAHKSPKIHYQKLMQDPNQMKGCLASSYPFIFGFTAYQSFESDQVAQTGHVPMPEPEELVVRSHAALAVGYDDANQWFIVRNSWGTNWGMQGYFTIPYAYLMDATLAKNFWTIRVFE